MTDTEQFEVVQFVEPVFRPGQPYSGPDEEVLGVFPTEAEAVDVARGAWTSFREDHPYQVAWWVVRVPGERLARWIADSRLENERVLDLRTQEYVEI
jgi:hypothetical protein